MKPADEIWLNLGCGIHPLADFINVDKYFSLEDLLRAEGIYCHAVVDEGAEFVQADILSLPFPDDFADYILVDSVIEHLDMTDIIPALYEWRRVLKPAGELVVITVDFNELANLWLTHITGRPHDDQIYSTLAQIIYGNQAGPGEHHCCPFTHDYLKLCLARAGFPFFTIDYHPTNAPALRVKGYPPIPEGEEQVCLTSVLVAKAYKQIPTKTDSSSIVYLQQKDICS